MANTKNPAVLWNVEQDLGPTNKATARANIGLSTAVTGVSWDSNSGKLTSSTPNANTGAAVVSDVVSASTIISAGLPPMSGHVGNVLKITDNGSSLGLAWAADNDSHRAIKVKGNDFLGDNTTALNFQEGGTVTLTKDSSGNLTISAADQYTGTVTSVSAGNGLTGGPITSTGSLSVKADGTSITVGASGIKVTNPITTPANGDIGQVLTVSNNSGGYGWAVLPSVSTSANGIVPKFSQDANNIQVLTVAKNGTTPTWSTVSAIGDGNVKGPGSAVDGNVAMFSGTTGKFIADTGYSYTNLALNADVAILEYGNQNLSDVKILFAQGKKLYLAVGGRSQSNTKFGYYIPLTFIVYDSNNEVNGFYFEIVTNNLHSDQDVGALRRWSITTRGWEGEKIDGEGHINMTYPYHAETATTAYEASEATVGSNLAAAIAPNADIYEIGVNTANAWAGALAAYQAGKKLYAFVGGTYSPDSQQTFTYKRSIPLMTVSFNGNNPNMFIFMDTIDGTLTPGGAVDSGNIEVATLDASSVWTWNPSLIPYKAQVCEHANKTNYWIDMTTATDYKLVVGTQLPGTADPNTLYFV